MMASQQAIYLLGAGVLGDGLGAFRDGVLGQFTGQKESDAGLHLPGSDGGAFVVLRQTARLGGNSLEDVVHERVHDGHGLRGDASVGVDLLQDLVDVDGEGLLALAVLLLLVGSADGLLGLAGLLDGFTGAWWGHGCERVVDCESESDRMTCCGLRGEFIYPGERSMSARPMGSLPALSASL